MNQKSSFAFNEETETLTAEIDEAKYLIAYADFIQQYNKVSNSAAIRRCNKTGVIYETNSKALSPSEVDEFEDDEDFEFANLEDFFKYGEVSVLTASKVIEILDLQPVSHNYTFICQSAWNPRGGRTAFADYAQLNGHLRPYCYVVSTERNLSSVQASPYKIRKPFYYRPTETKIKLQSGKGTQFQFDVKLTKPIILSYSQPSPHKKCTFFCHEGSAIEIPYEGTFKNFAKLLWSGWIQSVVLVEYCLLCFNGNTLTEIPFTGDEAIGFIREHGGRLDSIIPSVVKQQFYQF